MNAEAQAWPVAPCDPDDTGITAAPSGRPDTPVSQRTPATQRAAGTRRTPGGATPGSPGPRHPPRPANRRPRVVEPDENDGSWNVLAEELLSYPKLATRVLSGASSEARERTGTARDDRKYAEHARRYGEAWLARELIAIRHLADAGYPALDRRLTGPARVATARAATAPGTAGGRAARHSPARTATAGLAPARTATTRGATAGVTARFDNSDPERRARSARDAVQARTTDTAAELRGLRRLLPGVATLVALAGLWLGGGMLAAGQHPPLAVLPGSVKTPAGYVYVVRPGDTLWSIATRLQPGGDPRVLVAELESQVPGGTLVPGSRLLLP